MRAATATTLGVNLIREAKPNWITKSPTPAADAARAGVMKMEQSGSIMAAEVSSKSFHATMTTGVMMTKSITRKETVDASWSIATEIV